MNYTFLFILLLGVAISIGDMMTRFKNHHKYKNSIMYKDSGYGLQVESLHQDGFNYHIFMRNHPTPPPKYNDKFFPLFVQE